MSGSDSPAAAFDVAEGVAILERTPVLLRAWLAGLPEPWIRVNEGADTWNAFDVVGHLIDGEETDWIPRARIILAQQGDRRFTPYDRFRHQRVNVGATLGERLERFERLRAENVAILRGWALTPAQLALTGMHPELGEVTMAQLLATWVAHDLDHVMQIARVMGKRYATAVGPWTVYLRVVRS